MLSESLEAALRHGQTNATGVATSLGWSLYAEAVPAATPLTVRSDGPTTADPVPGVAIAEPWPECLRGDIAAGFSLVLYQGGSVADLDACAGTLDVSALYVLHGGAWVSYILGATHAGPSCPPGPRAAASLRGSRPARS